MVATGGAVQRGVFIFVKAKQMVLQLGRFVRLPAMWSQFANQALRHDTNNITRKNIRYDAKVQQAWNGAHRRVGVQC